MNNRKNSPTDPLKTQAKALRKYLTEQGIELGHSKCLEAVAQMHGHKNWDTASAKIKEAPALLFMVSNHHIPESGTPPILDGDEPGYFSYFENYEGEQAVLHWDREANEGTLYMGDCEWDEPIKVDAEGRTTPGTVFGPEERLWLRGCFVALGILRRPKLFTLGEEEVKEAVREFTLVHGHPPTFGAVAASLKSDGSGDEYN